MKFKLVVATRGTESDFYLKTATGRSLVHKSSSVELRLFANNKKGLSDLYNEAIDECRNDPAILVFAHDDLHFLDYFWCSRLAEGLDMFPIIGIVGNKRRVSRQLSWAFIDDKFTWDKATNLSGVIGHGAGFPHFELCNYGPTRQQVVLLDGLMLAAKSETLIENNLYFDERFDFHFYDLDFCRQAEQKSLALGTWDLALIHESIGRAGSDDWLSAYSRYLDKWGD